MCVYVCMPVFLIICCSFQWDTSSSKLGPVCLQPWPERSLQQRIWERGPDGLDEDRCFALIPQALPPCQPHRNIPERASSRKLHSHHRLQSAVFFTSRMLVALIDWLNDWLVYWLNVWLNYWLVDWLLFGWLIRLIFPSSEPVVKSLRPLWISFATVIIIIVNIFPRCT